MTIECVIISNLLFNEGYARKVIPFLKQDYFSDYIEKTLFNLINDYVQKYNSFPSKEALAIDLSNKDGLGVMLNFEKLLYELAVELKSKEISKNATAPIHDLA